MYNLTAEYALQETDAPANRTLPPLSSSSFNRSSLPALNSTTQPRSSPPTSQSRQRNALDALTVPSIQKSHSTFVVSSSRMYSNTRYPSVSHTFFLTNLCLSIHLSPAHRPTRLYSFDFYHSGSTLQATQERGSKPPHSDDEESGSEVSESEDDKPAATSKQVLLCQVKL